jgi:hypothetical protein
MKRIAKVFGSAALGLALLATTVQAQSSTPVTWNVGVGLSMPSTSGLNTGFHARFGAMIPLASAPVWIRPEVGLDHLGVSCAGCGSLTLFGIGADVGYTFKTTTEVGWYILGGLQITDQSYSVSAYSTSITRLGMNLGGGMTFPLANHVGYLELRFVSTGGNIDMWPITFGLRF